MVTHAIVAFHKTKRFKRERICSSRLILEIRVKKFCVRQTQCTETNTGFLINIIRGSDASTLYLVEPWNPVEASIVETINIKNKKWFKSSNYLNWLAIKIPSRWSSSTGDNTIADAVRMRHLTAPSTQTTSDTMLLCIKFWIYTKNQLVIFSPTSNIFKRHNMI